MAPFFTFIICLFLIIYSFFHWALEGQTRIYKGETPRVHSYNTTKLMFPGPLFPVTFMISEMTMARGLNLRLGAALVLFRVN